LPVPLLDETNYALHLWDADSKQTMEVTEHTVYLTSSHCLMSNLSQCKYPDSKTTAHLIILLCSIASFITLFTTAHHWTLPCAPSTTPFFVNEEFNIMPPFTLHFFFWVCNQNLVRISLVSHVQLIPPTPSCILSPKVLSLCHYFTEGKNCETQFSAVLYGLMLHSISEHRVNIVSTTTVCHFLSAHWLYYRSPLSKLHTCTVQLRNTRCQVKQDLYNANTFM
jgi:hypothetical protein